MFVLDLGMDMSGFSSAMSAMMMSPSFQAVMNPFLMSGNGSAAWLNLLSGGAGQFFPNLPTPHVSAKTMSQLWMMNNKVSTTMVIISLAKILTKVKPMKISE